MAKSTQFPSFEDAFAWLAARTNYETMATQRYDERTYGLDRAERLLAAAGHPDHEFDVAQVVGSKGKGSTATMLAEILRASGRRAGLFTSPHLVDPRERIRIDGEVAPDRLVCGALASLVPHADEAARRGEPLTFFEVHTVAALLVFRAAGCDAVVLEAGMGGRLDATTAARAVVKVLTSLSLDHTRHLGRTRTSIAREKASAARRGVPFVSGERVTSAAGREIVSVCRKVRAPLVAIGRDFDVRDVRTAFDPVSGLARTWFRLDGARLREPESAQLDSVPDGTACEPETAHELTPSPGAALEVPMLGLHQAANAALAAMAATTARWRGARVTMEHVRAGLARTSIRARLETLATSPLVLVDGAHNPASLGVLAHTVFTIAPKGPRVFVVGMSADKDVRGCLRKLAGVATLVVATTSGQTRALPAAKLAAVARAAGLRATTAADVPAALERARTAAGATGTVVVTGSLYLCGELLRLWR